MLEDIKVIAVVGASRNPQKWGYKVFLALRRRFPDKHVYPVNPNASEIAGVRCYPNLSSLPERPDLVVTVVPPSVTERVVEEAAKVGAKLIWMQPGSESEKAIRRARELGLQVIHHACIVETTGGLPEELR